MGTPAPPPPPPSGSSQTSISTEKTASTNNPFNIIAGTTAEATMFEFPECPTSEKNSVALRVVVRQYVGAPNIRSVAAHQLYAQIGRFRCLEHVLEQYNQGILLASATAMFQQYWRPRLLNTLSAFGFSLQQPGGQINIRGLKDLIQKLEELCASDIKTHRDRIEGGQITFDALGELYRPGQPIKGRTALGVPAFFMLTDAFYEERRSLMGTERSFHFSMDYVICLGQHFATVGFTEVLSGWTGARARTLSELVYVPATALEWQFAKGLGERYVSLAHGAQFVAYAPQSFFLHGTKTSHLGVSTSGRIMIDVSRGASAGHYASQGGDEATLAMTQFATRYRRHLSTQGSSDAMNLWTTVPAELFGYCWPALVGFSFTAKAWGHVLVSGLSPIDFNTKAFDQLVISQERKQLLRALIQYTGDSDTDLIGGKNGGSVILLHGPPGVGKTLTAEAIAETLKRPMYYVTMGELGTEPQELERRLSGVLDICAEWNAIALLDEADVFLETRTTHDLVRNALVCVMLRLLEYYPGILFLTTNRVRSIDPAVESRVTLALRYDPLTIAARTQIWRNLLDRCKYAVAKEMDYAELGARDMNGRQIKNAVRLAVALAREQGSPLSMDVLKATIEVTSLGRRGMDADDSWHPSNE